jgi:hypothetical protein
MCELLSDELTGLSLSQMVTIFVKNIAFFLFSWFHTYRFSKKSKLYPKPDTKNYIDLEDSEGGDRDDTS